MTTAKLLWKREYSDARCQAFPAKLDPVQLAAFRVREKLRTIQLGIGARGAVGVGLARQRGGAAVSPWWLAGGAPTPVAVYQPKGAASLAASYVNLANPGTYDAALGVAPTFDAGTGWTLNGSQYLATGVIQSSQSWSFLVRYSDVVGSNGPTVLGAYSASFRSEIHPYWFGNSVLRANGSFSSASPALLSGVYCMAGVTAYRNGSPDGTVAVNAGTQTQAFEIGKLGGDATSAFFLNGKIQAAAIYNTTLTAGEVAAVSAAMAAL